ncbi:MAG TPA: pyrimidine reductase family protein [Streptosporangiaceae bacterium]|nr:pyrimidine reductase family protein [Streptosporangiaceae bacterium]
MFHSYSYDRLTDDDLTALYAFPAGPVLRANMVSSADGAAALGGLSAGLSGAADRHVFALNRTLADVILAGAGTVRAEGYKPARVRELWRHLRDGRAPTPPIAVITNRLDLDPAMPLIAAAPPHARTIVITTSRTGSWLRDKIARHADVVVAGDVAVDLHTAVKALHERGHEHVLCEGGPALLGALTDAGLTDELCLTIGPLLAGPGASRIVTGAPTPAAVPLHLAHVIESDGFLLTRYTTAPPA